MCMLNSLWVPNGVEFPLKEFAKTFLQKKKYYKEMDWINLI